MRRFKIGILAVLVSLLCVCLPIQVHAIDRMDETKTGSVTLKYPVDGIEFSLYRVGEIGGFGEITACEEYEEYPIDFADANWEELALTVDGYIEKDGIQPTVNSISANGEVKFENLELGLYLVRWNSHKKDGISYISSPYFITVPYLNEEEEWEYDLVSETKYTTEEYDMIDLRVHKVWEDDQNAAKKRPAAITVELLCNGEVEESVVLNAENGWSYAFENLDASYTWRIVEKDVPEGYTVKVTQEGSTVLVTNTLPTPSETPETPVTPPNEPKKPKPELPYTGVLWWPVPVLCTGGLLLVMSGIVLRRKEKKDEM